MDKPPLQLLLVFHPRSDVAAGLARDIYLGLNAGRVGFLLNDVKDWDIVADQIKQQAWQTYSFPLLEALVSCADGTTQSMRAVNDILIVIITFFSHFPVVIGAIWFVIGKSIHAIKLDIGDIIIYKSPSQLTSIVFFHILYIGV